MPGRERVRARQQGFQAAQAAGQTKSFTRKRSQWKNLCRRATVPPTRALALACRRSWQACAGVQTPSPLLSDRDVLILEDDAGLRRRLTAQLTALGAHVTEASRVEEARRLLQAVRFDFALIDLQLPDGEALALLREGAFSENTGVVVMTAYGSVQKAVEAMRLGAGDYLSKPFEPEAVPLAFSRCHLLRTSARREEHRSSSPMADTNDFFFGGTLAPLQQQLDAILAAERRLTRQIPPVSIEGETGTGKSALARWLHRQGPRTDQPFVSVNCATLTETLAESELFGHERGAFTDAKRARIGLFEAADGGTLFLDEIGTLSAAIQAKVLVAVEEGKIRRLGSNREIAVNVRLITATNRPLEALVRQGLFREDLYHRLNLLALTLPPLRERRADVVELASRLLARVGKRHHLKNLSLSRHAEQRLHDQSWPGNVRELGHELERAVIFEQGPIIELRHLAPPLLTPAPGSTLLSDQPWRNPAWQLPESGFALDDMISELVRHALALTEGNVSAAARRLGVTREFIRYRLNRPSGPTTPTDPMEGHASS